MYPIITFLQWHGSIYLNSNDIFQNHKICNGMIPINPFLGWGWTRDFSGGRVDSVCYHEEGVGWGSSIDAEKVLHLDTTRLYGWNRRYLDRQPIRST